MADRPYHWSFNRTYINRILLFGWPLAVNALLMFGYQQGDQVLIGAHYSMASLAQYSLAVSITMIPGYMFQYVVNTVMLPLLSQVQDDPATYRRRYLFCAELSTVAGVLIACFLIVGGEMVIVTAFGRKYAGSGAIVGCLAVANAFRIIRAVPSLAAMARGDTVNNLIANCFRVSSLVLSAFLVFAGAPLVWVAACGTVGELLALGAAWHRLSKKCGIPVAVGLKSVMVAMPVMGVAAAISLVPAASSKIVAVLLCIGACCGAAALMWGLFGEFRRCSLQTLAAMPATVWLARLLGGVRPLNSDIV
jgi:PST family polysaccharide transporter